MCLLNKPNNSNSSLNKTSFVLFADWALTLREERRLRLFENRELRRIFGAKRDEVTGKWGKLHNEELSDLYCLPNIFA